MSASRLLIPPHQTKLNTPPSFTKTVQMDVDIYRDDDGKVQVVLDYLAGNCVQVVTHFFSARELERFGNELDTLVRSAGL